MILPASEFDLARQVLVAAGRDEAGAQWAVDSAQGWGPDTALSDQPAASEVVRDEPDVGSPWTANEALAWLAEHRALVRVLDTDAGERRVLVTVRPPARPDDGGAASAGVASTSGAAAASSSRTWACVVLQV